MPPRPVRQTAPTANGVPRAVPVKSGSLLSRARPVETAYTNFVHMLLYGRNRVGKTTLACTFPKPLLLVSVESTPSGGARSVSNVPGVSVLRMHMTDPDADMKSSAEVEQLGKELRADPNVGGYRSVVFDSGTSLDEIVLAELCGWDETTNMLRYPKKGEAPKVSQDQYTQRSEVSRQALRPFVDLKCHVVVLCNEKDHNPPEGRKSSLTRSLYDQSFYAASMGGGTVRWLQDCMDFNAQLLIEKEAVEQDVPDGTGGTVRMAVETGRNVRRLRCQYHPNFAAGFRAPVGVEVPEFIDAPTWEKIEAVANGKPLAKAAPRK